MPHLKETYPNTQLYKRAAMKEKKVVKKKKNYETLRISGKAW